MSKLEHVKKAIGHLRNAQEELEKIVPPGEDAMQQDLNAAQETITLFLMDQIHIIQTYLAKMRTELAQEQKMTEKNNGETRLPTNNEQG